MLSLVHRQSSCILVSTQLFSFFFFFCYMEISDPFLSVSPGTYRAWFLHFFCARMLPCQGVTLLILGNASFQPSNNTGVSSFVVPFEYGGRFHWGRCGRCLHLFLPILESFYCLIITQWHPAGERDLEDMKECRPCFALSVECQAQ